MAGLSTESRSLVASTLSLLEATVGICYFLRWADLAAWARVSSSASCENDSLCFARIDSFAATYFFPVLSTRRRPPRN